MTKEIWRARMRKLLESSSEEVRISASIKINKKLKTLLVERGVKTIHTFLPKGLEIDIYPTIKWALRNNLTVIVPKVLERPRLAHLQLLDLDQLKSGKFNTKFPDSDIVHYGPYDLIIVPGLAFDKRGNRIGHGIGYYDVFLTGQKDAFKIGVCFLFQLVDKIPVEEHDIAMDMVVTGSH